MPFGEGVHMFYLIFSRYQSENNTFGIASTLVLAHSGVGRALIKRALIFFSGALSPVVWFGMQRRTRELFFPPRDVNSMTGRVTK